MYSKYIYFCVCANFSGHIMIHYMLRLTSVKNLDKNYSMGGIIMWIYSNKRSFEAMVYSERLSIMHEWKYISVMYAKCFLYSV